jgi:hypothetical protein
VSANDNSARPVVFQTRAGAEAHCLRLARAGSPSGRVPTLRYVPGVYQAEEGGKAYEVRPGTIDWLVREVPADELARRVQSGIRGEVDRLLECAGIAAARASQLLGTSFSARHTKDAAQYRERARALETELTVSAVRSAS